MKILIVFPVFFGILLALVAQEPCITPNGHEANCVNIYQCPTFLNALQNLTPEVTTFMKQSRCSEESEKEIKVCCGTLANFTKEIIFPSDSLITQPPKIREEKPLSHRNTILLPSTEQCGIQASEDYIIPGNITAIDAFPWMALLEYEKNGKSVGHHCGGTLFSKRYVLTAAHCIVGDITGKVGKLIRVRLGEFDTTTNPDCEVDEFDEKYCVVEYLDVNVEETIAHPDYMDGGINRYHDIGVIRLERNIEPFSETIVPICLPLRGGGTKIGLHAVGWGASEKGIASSLKGQVPLSPVDDQTCATKLSQEYNLKFDARIQLCVGGKTTRQSCTGDSGGPLMYRTPHTAFFYIEGVSAFRPSPCNISGIPGLYTRVPKYTAWILDNMRP